MGKKKMNQTSSTKRSQKKRQNSYQKKTAKNGNRVLINNTNLDEDLSSKIMNTTHSYQKGNTKSNLVKLFLETLTSIRLYHWRTHSYAQHKATDDLYKNLEEKIDEFVEVMQGKMLSSKRIDAINDEIKMSTPGNKKDLLNRMLSFNEKLQHLDFLFDPKKDSDLLNIRDELMGIVNRFIYLYSFDEI